MKGHFLLKPIAKIGDDSVRMYEFIGYSLSNEQQILERMADDIAFKKRPYWLVVDKNSI